ncbi:glutathione S-transferase N-terminal domain-containing protein [Roseibacterium sp. SDUM158017]|uniref:glutathione S-transferase family protein n=1 Tax=Roseicyclus salinarum TaxID=3036773 RepID=UPI0024155711|nr:glutathione binding-like protein [Roseibacterium sp. SDUM158017]MDG4647523.1 glutathione S-transferase N-terminal domain-containing protein [Roseibacterium sp. SDUM158017]
MPRPDIVLFTANTMNGWKPLIFLHEADIEYDLVPIDFGKKEQKAPNYLKLNPNGRIPTIVDRGNDDFAVFESGAILWYLAEKYDRFLSHEPKERSETLQWLMFQMGGIGPMMGQAMFFQRIAKPNGDEVPYAIDRYVAESRRLLEVLDTRLAGRDWLVGDAMSVADIATYPWARSHFWATVSVEGLPHLQAWFERLDAMPRVQEALQLPEPRPSAFGQGDTDAAAAENAARFR